MFAKKDVRKDTVILIKFNVMTVIKLMVTGVTLHAKLNLFLNAKGEMKNNQIIVIK